MDKELRNAADPMGLLSEPTSEEMQAWEKSEVFSDNEYAFIGWLVNYRKRKLEKEWEEALSKNAEV